MYIRIIYTYVRNGEKRGEGNREEKRGQGTMRNDSCRAPTRFRPIDNFFQTRFTPTLREKCRKDTRNWSSGWWCVNRCVGAVRMHCRREKNLENISKMSVESMKIARNRFYFSLLFFFSPDRAKNKRRTRFDRLCSTRLRKIWDRTREGKLSPSSFIPNLNRPTTREMNVQRLFPLRWMEISIPFTCFGPPFSLPLSDITIFRAIP